MGTGEMTQQLRAPAAFTEGLGSVLTPTLWLKVTHYSSSRRSDTKLENALGVENIDCSSRDLSSIPSNHMAAHNCL